MLILLVACMDEGPGEGPLDPLRQDYRLDRLRVLGIRSHPTWLVEGEPATFEVLARGPDGDAEDATWATCGYAPWRKVEIDGVGCFLDADEVVEVGRGLTPTWTPPTHDPAGEPCVDGTCLGRAPLWVDVIDGAESASGLFWGTIWEPGTVSSHPSYEEVGWTLRADRDGATVHLSATLGLRVASGGLEPPVVTWFVDDGELLEGGVTTIDPEGRVSVAENTWVLPTRRGSYRALVVVSGALAPEEGAPDSPAYLDPGGRDGGNTTWAWVDEEVP